MDDNAAAVNGLEPSYGLEDEPETAAAHPRDRVRPPAGRRAYRSAPAALLCGLIKLAVALIIVVASPTAAWQYRYSIAGIYQFFAHARKRGNRRRQQPTPATPNKFSGRVPQELSARSSGRSRRCSARHAGGRRRWRSASCSTKRIRTIRRASVSSAPRSGAPKRSLPVPGMAPELAVRADIEIPERRMTVTWSLAAQHRQGAAGEPHDRGHVQSAG